MTDQIIPAAPSSDAIPVSTAALELYDLGFNVFPIPVEEDPSRRTWLPWKKLRYTRLPRNHEVYGLRRLFAGRCDIGVVLGKTSGNLFVLECLSDQAFDRALMGLQNHGIARWATKGARGGDIWLRCAEGELQTLLVVAIPGVELIGHSFTLAPPSEAAPGSPLRWAYREGDEPPLVTRAQMDWLFFNGEKRITWWDGYPVSLSLAGQPASEHGLQRQQALSEARAWREQALLAFAEEYDWRGKAGTTDRNVFLALVYRMRVDSNVTGTFRASERELSELAHHGRKAVHAALVRLLAAGLIEMVGKDRSSRANRYRFCEQTLRTGESLLRRLGTVPEHEGNGVNSTLPDVLEPAALGRTALDIHAALLRVGRPLPQRAIAAFTGFSINKVRTALKRLQTYGLVKHSRQVGYTAIPKSTAEFEAIAVEAETVGRSAKRRQEHLEDQARDAGRLFLAARQRYDEGNLPVVMQRNRAWRCPACGEELRTKVGLLPASCPACGNAPIGWQQVEEKASKETGS